MRKAWLPLVVLAMGAGCAGPPPGTLTVPLEGDAALTRTEAACASLDCSWEWWNLTVEGEGRRMLLVPLPAVVSPERGDLFTESGTWAANVTFEGGLALSVGAGSHVMAQGVGLGPGVVRTHRVSVAPPERFAEAFLWARWGPEANMTRPSELPVTLSGGVDALRITYEAHGARCRRVAEYALAGPLTTDRVVWVPGRDRGECR